MQLVVEWERKDGGQFVSTHITNWIDPDETSAMSDQKINVVGTKGRFQADQKKPWCSNRNGWARHTRCESLFFKL